MNSATNKSNSNSPSNQGNHSVASAGQSGQEWCIHAQLTISHPQTPARAVILNKTLPVVNRSSLSSSISDKNTKGIGSVGHPDPGSNVQFQYSWTTSDTGTTFTQVVPEETGIQKFESWPRSSDSSGVISQSIQHDSGYNTERNTTILPNSSSKGRIIQPYGRRCKTTCTIILSNNIEERPEFTSSGTSTSHDKRSSSLERPIFGKYTYNAKSNLKDAETQTTLNRDPTPASAERGRYLNYDHLTAPLTPSRQGSNIGRGSYVDRRKPPDPLPLEKSEMLQIQQHSSRSVTRSFTGSARAKSSPPARSHKQ